MTIARKREKKRTVLANSQRGSRGIRLTTFARSLWQEWRRLELPATKARVVVAVSGGADSVALLLSLNELIESEKLKLKLFVAHLDHALRKNSKADARWVKALAKQLGYESLARRVDVQALAARSGDNLEQAARRARYKFLADVAKKKRASFVLTAHTMDDQTETVLLNLLRGSGMDGLSGMEPARRLGEGSEIILARPLLSGARRKDTEDYCRLRGVEFRTDEMNDDEKFARVRVRRHLLPQMESFNPKIVEGLARTAELLREDFAALDQAAGRLLELATEDGARSRLRVDLLALAHPALRRRALRQWIEKCRGDLKRIERVHVLAVESLLFGDRGGRVIELPGGPKVLRRQKWLHFAVK
ncbi:MAG TPA: tRNA lysidine(34) synthetase TilS [Pyrinomonadaceae bacterium]|nr:tRNA lysidine(34) synthetase TilS [Pyrinomonadaceae bacterium]